MQIKSIEVKGLYGYIDKNIVFNEDLTIMVGINGSGKTTILNIINWLTKPAIGELSVLDFKSIMLKLSYKDTEYTITCKHLSTHLKYYITNPNNKKKYNPLTVRRKANPKNIETSEKLEELIRDYNQLGPDEKERETWDLISSFPKPTSIGLDRNLYDSESSLFTKSGDNFNPKKLNKLINSPLEQIKQIVNTEYRKRKNDILILTNDLKNYLIFTAFETGVITTDSLNSPTKNRITLSIIERAQNKVKEYFNKFEIGEYSEIERNALTNYFQKLKELIINYSEDRNNSQLKLLYNLNSAQFNKINKILTKFEEFEIKSFERLGLINRYLATINTFLKDSAKQIVFKEDTTELSYNVLDKDGKPIVTYKDLKYLSSGEQQILILFSHIAFNSSDGRVFIIDEPELSLHIKWQEDFLIELEKITPKSTQIIVATHSPILVNKKKDKVKLLFPYNN